MQTHRHVAVIGAGQAAARSIAALRAAGFDGTVTLIGEETELPYERPPLSKEALFGDAAPGAATIFDETFYRDNEVELLLGRRVSALDAASGEVRMSGGGRLRADRLLLATGARARGVAIPGVEAGRIFTLRNLADARRLRERLTPPCRLVLIGGGFIGLEIAAGAARRGCTVTLIETRSRLIGRAVSPAVSALLRELHEAHGVSIRTGCAVSGAREGRHETELLLDDGSRCVADLIVAGVGAVPNAELAREAGIACADGIDVDADCRTRSPIVWAAGDVAARVHAFWQARVRFESWDNAEAHAVRAARSIAASWNGAANAGDAAAAQTEPPPWFWTDQYDLNLQILGCVTDSDRVVTRRNGEGKPSLLFHFRAGRLRGAELINAGKERALVRKLLETGGAPPADEQLADGDVPLKTLVSAARAAAAAAWSKGNSGNDMA